MYQGKHLAQSSPRRRGRRPSRRAGTLLLSLLLLVTMTIGGTVAYLVAKSGPAENTFTPSRVSCEVTEEFDGETKSEVNVKNTGDTDAYIRVRLVSYRVNDAKEHIGGTAEIPEFTPGYGWVEHGGYYYYTQPVAPGEKPAADLIDSKGITLVEYKDADGGKQVIEVIAEAIQSAPDTAVENAWGVTIAEGSVTANDGN